MVTEYQHVFCNRKRYTQTVNKIRIAKSKARTKKSNLNIETRFKNLGCNRKTHLSVS